MDKKFVYYSDFGAVGDGVTNDFEAIREAHIYANENHLPVKADGTKTYYISDTEKDGVARYIPVKTDTDFSGAHFVIDDREIYHIMGAGQKNWNTPIFKVLSYYDQVTIDEDIVKKIGSLKTTTTKIDVGLGYPAMLIVYNENHRVYIRYGANANTGAPQHELVVIDKDGNVDPTTPIMHDYKELTKIEAVRIDIPTLTIENGVFTQRASNVNSTITLPDGTTKKYTSGFKRNILVSRSNTILRKIDNYNVDEISIEDQAKGITGPAYQGFFSAGTANNVLITDCVVSARRYYAPGTYGFGATLTNNIVLKNCHQENFYIKDENGNDTTVMSMEFHPLTNKPVRWGLGGTNYCKNMVYDGCEITRFDAHAGLCNGKIINSKITMINLIGTGDMLIENSRIELKDDTIFNLRPDYGSTWDGTITIKDCLVAPNDTVKVKDELTVCNMKWINHDFGYRCVIPNLVLDNVRFSKDVPVHIIQYKKLDDKSDSAVSEPNIHLPILSDGVTENKNPMVPPKFIKVINNEGGLNILAKDLKFFENTELIGLTHEE